MSVLTPSLAGGWIEGTAERADVGDMRLDGLLQGRLLAPEAGSNMRARITFEDGATSLLAASPRGYAPYPITQDLVLGALERPWGIEDGVPTWMVEVSLQGHVSALGQVRSMSLTATREDGTRMKLEAPAPGEPVEVRTSVPLRFDAIVEFDPVTGREPLSLRSHATLRSKISAEPLAGVVRVTGAQKVAFDPNSWEDPSAAQEPATYATIYLAGWESALRAIDRVEYLEVDKEAKQFVDDYKPALHVVSSRAGGSKGAFSHPFTFLSPNFDFTPTVHFKDGRAPLELPMVSADDSLFRPEMGARSRVQYWGQTPDGAPAWLMHCDADTSLGGFRPNHVRYYFADGNNAAVLVDGAPVGPWPISEPLQRGRRYIESQILPGLPAEVITANVPELNYAPRFAMESYHPGQIPRLAKRTLKVRAERLAQIPESLPAQTLEIVCAPFQGSAPDGLQRIALRGPLAETAQLAQVRWVVERGGTTATMTPFSVDGHGHERFDTRIEGAAPTSITAELLSGDGEVVRTLHWTLDR